MSAPDFDLTGRRALVTGSTEGIGLGVAERLARAGASVVLHGLPQDSAGETALARLRAIDLGVTLVAIDLAEPDAAGTLLEAAGPVDILVSNVAIQIRRPWEQMDAALMQRHFAVNTVAAYELMLAVLPAMRAKRWGRIVNIGSVQQFKPHPELLIYAGLKAAQVNIVQNLARRVGADGVTVNTVAPGVIVTGRNAPVLADPDYAARVTAGIPLGEFGTPEDIAGVVLMLCSQAGRYITGADIPVDGGMHL